VNALERRKPLRGFLFMTIDLLFSCGSHLSDVPPDFRGLPMREWHAAQLSQQAASKRALAFWKQFEVDGKPPITLKKVETPRQGVL